jgi:hypothetical protein
MPRQVHFLGLVEACVCLCIAVHIERMREKRSFSHSTMSSMSMLLTVNRLRLIQSPHDQVGLRAGLGHRCRFGKE